MKMILIFIVLSIVNVIFATVRSITTIKSGKWVASLISAGYFAFYNIMLIYTVAEFSLVYKCIITFMCNLVGVFIVKVIEEKMQKDKLWKIEVTVPIERAEGFKSTLDANEIPNNYIIIGKYILFNAYCATQKESKLVKQFGENCKGKFFATETKLL